MNIDIEKLILEHLKSEAFAYALAEQISQQYKTELFDEFGGKIAEEMHKRVKELTSEFIADFGKSSDIKWAVDKAIANITKKELLDKL